ncbi:MAG: thioredoxin domain-containing protein, partial [Rhodobiaceae bacterium]|nr:thioredoxin domain-containing protein [Rhodobiaceae bacterium]
MRQSGIILTVIAALLFALPGRVSAAETVDQAAIEQIVRDYLLKNPEVIRDALAELDRREKAAAVAQQRDAIAAQHAALTSGAEKTVVGNPDGDVTLVEFFDYNCGFCKRAHSDMKDLLASDPNLRVVYKEWPFL